MNLYSKYENFKNRFLTYKNWWRFYLPDKKEHRLILRNGIKIVGPRSCPIYSIVDEIILRKIYNPKYLNIGNNDIVVDIGANVGIFSIFASSFTKNKILAYEPLLLNIKYLKRNIKINNLQNISVFEEAISNKNGETYLYITESSAGNLLFNRNIEGKLFKKTVVRTSTLERIFQVNKLSKIDFLKLDCEGSEGDILSSSVKLLKYIKKMALEYHDNVSKLDHENIVKLLSKNKFKVSIKSDENSPFGFIYAYKSF